MFAYDPNISLSSGVSPVDIEYKINNDLINVYIWVEANRLTSYTETAEFMVIGSKRSLKHFSENRHILIGWHRIGQAANKKVLEILVYEELKRKELNIQCKKLY